MDAKGELERLKVAMANKGESDVESACSLFTVVHQCSLLFIVVHCCPFVLLPGG